MAYKKIKKGKTKKVSLRKLISDAYPDEKIVFFDGFDDAILGIDDEEMRIIYSVKKAISIIYKDTPLKKSDLTKEEIEEGVTVRGKRMEMTIDHFEFNVRGTKCEGCPIWLTNDFE
jgi:predicted transcriptional regulator